MLATDAALRTTKSEGSIAPSALLTDSRLIPTMFSFVNALN